MKDLLDLVQIVTRPKISAIEVISNSRNGSSKLMEFYNKLADGHFVDDDTAAQDLYKVDKQASVYKKLRNTLKARLIDYLFVIDVKQASYTDRQKAFYECYREWAAAKILFAKNARTAATSIARKILKISHKYEFIELNVDITHTLRLYYGTVDGDNTQYHLYNDEFKMYEQLWIHENKAEGYYLDLSTGFVNSKTRKIEFQAKAKAYFAEIEPSLKEYDSYQLHLCGRLVEIAIYTTVNDYRNTLEVCDRAIAFFEEKEYIASIPLQIFYYQKAICLMQLGNTCAAEPAFQQSLAYSEEGSFNWFKVQEFAFVLNMHVGNYEQARNILTDVLNHQPDLSNSMIEIWKIAEAYLYLLTQLGKVSMPDLNPNKSFRWNRFLNEIQVFSKDKNGMNTHVIILEILFLLAHQQFDELLKRVDAIDKYRTRYLIHDCAQRSNILIKILLQIPKSGYNKEKIIAKTTTDVQYLLALPIELAQQNFELEIIPYETIWQFALESIYAQTYA